MQILNEYFEILMALEYRYQAQIFLDAMRFDSQKFALNGISPLIVAGLISASQQR